MFISGGVLPESCVNVRVVKSRRDYIEGQVVEILKKSSLETIHPNNPYGIQPGCGRVNIPYSEQLKIKAGQIEESLFHIRKLQESIEISPIVPSPDIATKSNGVLENLYLENMTETNISMSDFTNNENSQK